MRAQVALCLSLFLFATGVFGIKLQITSRQKKVGRLPADTQPEESALETGFSDSRAKRGFSQASPDGRRQSAGRSPSRRSDWISEISASPLETPSSATSTGRSGTYAVDRTQQRRPVWNRFRAVQTHFARLAWRLCRPFICPSVRRRFRHTEHGPIPAVNFRMGLETGQAALADYCGMLRLTEREACTETAQQVSDLLISTQVMPPDRNLVFESLFNPGSRVNLTRGELLGCGGTSNVYSMTQEDGTKVAVKILSSYAQMTNLASVLSAGASAMKIMRREAGISELLGNQDLDDILYNDRLLVPSDVLRLPGKNDWFFPEQSTVIYNFFLAFPIAAGTLEDVVPLLDTTQKSFAARVSATVQMVKVVAGLHRKGLVHGDLKPSNFLVSNSGIVLLGDFSYAYVRGQMSTFPIITWAFFSPENIRMATQFSQVRVELTHDSWMLAFTIYFLWCGRLPWGIAIEEGDYRKIVAILDQNTPETLNFHNCNGIPAGIQQLIRLLLAKDPNRRWTPEKAIAELNIFKLNRSEYAAQT
ncbi:rhoptry kinase family protein ROP31 [Toxoplasma gondii p89]|uniref:Rhoptry kinase family protein ROP31 n=1 Tax=Toxoplasma gondii p89 TaxID=943119 RepID=A0A086JB19_TOXGO|nr:rhoptry kinase family protein ROP31 [Toxoplasma gondii p89]